MFNEVAQQRAARLAGALFLLTNAVGIFSEVYARGKLLNGDPTQVAMNIVGSERLYRLSMAADLIMFAGVVVLIWALYVLLRPANRDLALLALLLRVVEMAVSVTATIGSVIAVRILVGSDYMNVFEPEELHSLSRLARNVLGIGFDVGFIFTGFGSAVFAWLLLKSGYVPRVLAAWGVFASLLFAGYNLSIVAFPNVEAVVMYFCFAPMGIYEITLGFWLLLRGAKIAGAWKGFPKEPSRSCS